MPEMTLNRNYLYRSPNGVIRFEKGVETHVPPFMLRELLAIGAELVDGDAPSLVPEDRKLPPNPVGQDRAEQITAAIALIVERNDSSDFTGSGRPSVKAVRDIVGFELESRELGEAWDEFKVTLG